MSSATDWSGCPQSPDRDWMLREVGARAVDVESGVQPRPMRPFEVNADIARRTPSPPT